MRRYGRKISFSDKCKYDGLRGPYALANKLLRRYLNFCEGIWSSLVDSFLVVFSDPPLYVGFFTLYSFLLDHLDRTLVHHLNLYLSIYLVKHLLWLFVNGGGWNYTVQESSPHKCGQKSCCSAFNAVVTVFPLDISIFLSSPYVLEVHPHRWRLLEDHLNYPGTCLTNIRSIREE